MTFTVPHEPAHYLVAFDLLTSGYSGWWVPALGLAFVIFGIGFLAIQSRLTRRVHPSLTRIFPIIFLSFSVLWTIVATIATYGEYHSLRHAVESGNFEVIEGEVTNFVPMPANGHSRESFVVNGHRFEYSDNIVTAGFNNSSSHGGPIRPGLYVRISFVHTTIVRLEIRQ